MPDRRRRTAFRLQSPARAALLMRERQSSSPDPAPESPDSSPASGSPDSPSPDAPAKPADDNPFAPPPAGRPDQPWQPRHPSGSDPANGGEGEGSGGRSSWGGQWSNKQPGRGGGGFGGRSGTNGPGGKGGSDGGPGGMRWDPTDPMQRRARYALLGGIWSVFFALFDFTEVALLLGALSVYWAVSALRAQPKSPSATERTTVGAVTGSAAPAAGDGSASPTPTTPQGGGRPQTTAAISGLVTALLALIIVITTYTVQLVYRDYYTCVNDALTKTGAVACNDQLPKPLEPLFGVKE
ncbi:hypothetical protein J7F02_02350 [Streptomyces sp. ISL-112]|uniref:hypothetical protein n=1 Tax=unclassified Streptomyces TaxID=2593676 RepID=UPI001BE6E12B|nr:MULTISPECIES: hypothetical protein [unclassified Streptomyces]MBT2424578.1 hypothetical protein [Streptomyces sp. ISL-112]MBT2465113.1 hypothetical protein [Streptomyces sp. ISL-63]